MKDQMKKLLCMLVKEDVDFDIYAHGREREGILFNIQVKKHNFVIADIASSDSTYGGREGLLEIMRADGKLFDESFDEVIGWLDAQKAFDVIKQLLKEHMEV